MKILKCIFLTKYNNLAKYKKVNEPYIKYRSKDNFCVTLFCELEEGETKEDPYNDMCEKYKVRTTGYTRYAEVRNKRLCLYELEGSCDSLADNKKAISTVSKFAGKRIFNAEVGEFLELKVKALPEEELKDQTSYEELFNL
ncbi:MAG: hypothetical protein K5644_04065 [Lachnospiraceae bacterium]|nr:hypothetical protein [Lachnospiraceae bacterium]